VTDETRDSGPDASKPDSPPTPEAEHDPSKEEVKKGGLFEDVARVIGRTAGRTKDALARLGERGALAVAVRRLKRQRELKLKELGAITREALSESEGLLRRDDPRVAEVLQAIDRLDEKLAQMQERIEKGTGADDEKPDGDLSPDDETEADDSSVE
jgi:hypothetical protein